MLNQLALLFACLCALGGAALLYAGLAISDASQITKLLAGAVLLTLGLAIFRPVLKDWLAWKRYRRG